MNPFSLLVITHPLLISDGLLILKQRARAPSLLFLLFAGAYSRTRENMSLITNVLVKRSCFKAGWRRPSQWYSHYSTTAGNARVNKKGSKVVPVMAALALASIFAKKWYDGSQIKKADATSVTVDSSISAFPKKMGPPQWPFATQYELLGKGVRCVSSITFKAYGLGLYIAADDKHLVAEVLDSKFLSQAFIDTASPSSPARSHQENLRAALNDPAKAPILINNLLDSGIRLMSKNTPIKAGSFKLLMDGTRKSVLKNPDSQSQDKTRLEAGFQELHDCFRSVKGLVARDDDFFIELNKDCSVNLCYYARKKDEFVMLGTVKEPLIGKLLFAHYFAAVDPPSQEAKQEAMDALVSLA
ncbi:AIM46-like protein [Saccharomyces kudriavzevii IFO 1802]|uniref:Altered inheritance of mitochondria protein 18, mitochondrial n=2 Tax=Saccharomyces kudriavzevii (strain ATCC MYA-4449 / AS 2.2408 / CBS 8840 / NBRC 1802 / NCYC 2889) TaxID=226230 RepID=J5P820_SACK1|nr:AIM46-like protein [Saccharomyces kudriavzevii IFO 1802]